MFPKFKTKEEVPAAFADLYEERDGEWQAKVDPEIVRLKDETGAERTKREAAEKLAKKAATELAKLELKAKTDAAGLTDEKLTEIRAEVRKQVLEELAPELETGKAATARVRTLTLDNSVKALAAKAGFLGDKLDDYWKLHGDEFDLTDDGKPMVKANPGMTVEKLIDTHKVKRSEWVQGTKAAGGGAAGITAGGGGNGGTLTDAEILANPGLAY